VLRPSFTESCPSRIRRLGVACLQQESSRRPTARQLVEILLG
jgi:mitogen-activated protein kinase kinase kinase 7